MTTNIKSKCKILIVENNINIRISLVNLLKNNYFILEADDGEIGLIKALKHTPDLIVSGITLPHVNGFELCSKIKNNEKLFHIPVVMLTTRPDDNYEVTCIRVGADDYFAIPYNPQLLLEKIVSLIRSRKTLKENFSKLITIIGSEIKVKPHYETFLDKFISLVEENIQNPSLDVGFIAEKMNMSHASLYRRTKAINGTSVIDLIIQVRINRAYQLLRDKEKTLTQIALESGFCDLKRFRQSFQKQLSMSPKEFRGMLN